MRVSKPISLYLPELFVSDLDKYLKEHPPNFKFNRVYFYYVIHHLTVSQIIYKDNEYFPLNKTFLKSVTISNINRYIKILKNGEFIISDSSYEIEVKSLWYKLNPKFTTGVSKIEIEPNSKLARRIIKKVNQTKAHYNRLEPHLSLMKDELMKMELDYQKAYKWIEDTTDYSKKLSYATSINHIEDKRFRYFKRNKTNYRLDTNLTNLKSDIRQFIKGDYVSIDLKNAQPFLLGILIDNITNTRGTLCCYLQSSKIIKTFGIKKIRKILLIHQNQEKSKMVNLSFYKKSVLMGSFYEDLVNHFKDELTRKQVKDMILKVLFSRNEYHSDYKKIIPYEKEKEVFANVYPFVSEVVKILKIKGHKALPIYLQQIESYLFIDCIAKELVNNGIIPFTIHDSVIVKSEHQERTIEIMKKVFNKQVGLIPSFHIENLKNTINLNVNIPTNKTIPRICPVTREDISMQKDGSYLLSNTGFKHLEKSHPIKFKILEKKLLTGHENKFETDLYSKLAKQIRNRHYNNPPNPQQLKLL
tara:strand:+ start:1784 stop:3370 length:1587 start_codon:yes stop_codon:yes gene_type:complete